MLLSHSRVVVSLAVSQVKGYKLATTQGEQLKLAAERAQSVQAQASELKARNTGLEQQLQDAQLELSELKRLLEEKEVTSVTHSVNHSIIHSVSYSLHCSAAQSGV